MNSRQLNVLGSIVIVAGLFLAIGWIGGNENAMQDQVYVSDTMNVCQRAEDSYYDGQLHDRPAEDECSKRLDNLRASGRYNVTMGDEMPIITAR